MHWTTYFYSARCQQVPGSKWVTVKLSAYLPWISLRRLTLWTVIISAKLKLLPLNLYLVNWYHSFCLDGNNVFALFSFNNFTCTLKPVNKGTTQGSVSGPYWFNIFLTDLEIEHNSDSVLFKYVDDSTFVWPTWYNHDTWVTRAGKSIFDMVQRKKHVE